MKQYLSSRNIFQQNPAIIRGNRRLREPQWQACEALSLHFLESNRPALVQIPVGCGKTGLMAILPFGLSSKRTLIVAPNLTIRESIFEAVDSASPKCFWRNAQVAKLTPEGPFAAKIDGANVSIEDCLDSHFVVANIQRIGQQESKWLRRLPEDFFDLILIDEGHHNAAASWTRLAAHFKNAKFVSLTATPYRSDGKEVWGDPVYQYPFLRAMSRGYIKRLKAVHVAPSELTFSIEEQPHEVSIKEILRLREQTWFRRGVALSCVCNQSIVDASIRECESLRESGSAKHQIIAAACSVKHANQICDLYRKAGYRAETINSKQSKQTNQGIIKRLARGQIDVIVQVQMLGEGFDHPNLSVAAVFRPFRTLAPYIQFVGRIMRVVNRQAASSVDNQGVVVSHVGLNNESHWQEFRELDERDQRLWSGLIGTSENQRSVRPGTCDTSEFKPDVLIDRELLGELSESEFGIVQPAKQQLLPLLTHKDHSTIAGPQQLRREARSQLKDRVNDEIRRVLATTKLPANGWQIGRTIAFLRRQNNWSALRYWFYVELNRQLSRRPGRNKNWTLAELDLAFDILPTIREKIVSEIKSKIRRKTTWQKSDKYSNTYEWKSRQGHGDVNEIENI